MDSTSWSTACIGRATIAEIGNAQCQGHIVTTVTLYLERGRCARGREAFRGSNAEMFRRVEDGLPLRLGASGGGARRDADVGGGRCAGQPYSGDVRGLECVSSRFTHDIDRRRV